MRAFGCSLVLLFALTVLVLPMSGLVYAQQSAGAQNGQTDGGGQGLNPLARALLEQLAKQLKEQQESSGQGTGATGEQPPNGNGSAGQSDDVPAVDRGPPVISVDDEDFVSTKSTVSVRTRITDDIAVAGAVVSGEDIYVPMTEVRPTIYVATIDLPRNYRPISARIDASDRSGKRARPVQVTLRRNPACGSPDGVSAEIVSQVQRDLARLALYDDDIDGLAGPKTCAAITAADIPKEFSWPEVAVKIRDLVGLERIALVADLPETTLSEVNAVRVRVVDPGETRRVAAVRMRVDGNEVDTQTNDTGELGFMLLIEEGAQHRVTFEALDRERSRILSEISRDIEHPEPIGLDLFAPELAGGRLASDAAQVTLIADISGASSGRITYQGDNAAPPERFVHAGQPVSIKLAMPPRGESHFLLFEAQSGNRSAPLRRIELVRVRVIVPVVPEMNPEPIPPPAADPPAGLVRLPDPPPERPASVPPLPTPAMDTAPPAPPPPEPFVGPKLPEWLVPVALLVVLTCGMIAGLISVLRQGFRRHRPARPKVALVARVEAVPDKSPEIEVIGADLPGLILTVDQGTSGSVEIEFEREMESLDQ